MLNEQQFYLLGEIQTSQTGDQLHSDTSPYGECAVPNLGFFGNSIFLCVYYDLYESTSSPIINGMWPVYQPGFASGGGGT